ncbi:Vgb family protein [Pyxidicoccus xibeiensis]|uniref:Vgb family protein n=1 Tax=Pyxidicoccus xibeiensis TaxID=2906759 RepID=UPI0020A6E352|nr:PEP-CTERM sorting domain-containing protein [Pyxidicoccus xibeiensis]MCP3142610.1 PEP-CTERM sorting domain-containing protein [Pyxidicoccus xibeiensis]
MNPQAFVPPSRARLVALACCALAFTVGCSDDPPETPVGRGVLLIGNTRADNVVRVDAETGEFLEDFVADDGPAGLAAPDALVFGPEGDLYVSSGATEENSAIVRYDGETGEFVTVFAVARGLVRPYGLAFGPDGLMYVSSFLTDRILRFDGETGTFIDVFATGNGQPGGLNGPNGLAFGPDGRLYVTTQGSVGVDGQPTFPGLPSQVLRFDIATGAAEVFIDQPALSPAGQGYISLLGLAFGPDCGRAGGACDLFVSDFANDIRRYDLETRALEATLSTNYSGTVPSENNVGYLSFDDAGRLFTVGFDNVQGGDLRGAVLRFDGRTNAPLPSAGNTGAIFIPPTTRLVRPIGITFTRQ